MRGKLLTYLIAIVTIVFFSGLQACELGKVSKEDRIQFFEDDLNSSDRSEIKQNFHPTETADYLSGALNDYTTLFDDPTSVFALNKRSFSISITSIIGDNITALITSDIYTDENITFVMALSGLNDWRIEELSLTVGLDTIDID